jgi:hypothetical protein
MDCGFLLNCRSRRPERYDWYVAKDIEMPRPPAVAWSLYRIKYILNEWQTRWFTHSGIQHNTVQWNSKDVQKVHITSTFRVEELAMLTVCFMLLSCLAYSPTLKMKAKWSFETLGDFNLTTWWNIPEYRTLHSLRCEHVISKNNKQFRTDMIRLYKLLFQDT